MKSKISSVIFDFGGVLVNWDPVSFYTKIFNNNKQKAQWFINTVCTFKWHFEQDKGRLIKDAVAQKVAQFPKYEAEIKMYYDRWEEGFLGPIEKNVKVLTALHQQKKYHIFGLTNWSEELYPIGQRLFPFFSWFESVVVSGAIKLTKPDPAIYTYALQKFNISNPATTVFIDDNINNIKGATAMGINCIHYNNTVNLEEALFKLGLDIAV